MIYEYIRNLVLAHEAGSSSLVQKLTVFGLCVLLSLGFSLFIIVLVRWTLRKTCPNSPLLQKRVQECVKYPAFWCIALVGIHQSFNVFGFSEGAMEIIYRIYFFILVLLILRGLLNLVSFFDDALRSAAEKSKNAYQKLLLDLLVPIVKFLIWAACLLFLLDNVLKFKIGTLLAGAGVASMAIVFAAQSTIANLFGALTLIFDRPFQIGDRIKIDGKEGFVQALGLRSTRILALDGTVWNIPNKLMAESPIDNFSQRPYVRYTTVLNLTYSHTPEQLARGKELLLEIFSGHPLVNMEKNPPCISFENIGAYSLDLQVVCWLQTQDLTEFSRAKDELNFKILKTFNDNGFEFAFPTQTLEVESANALQIDK